MTMGPRLDPFPYDQFYLRLNVTGGSPAYGPTLSAFVNDPTNEGVQLNVRTIGPGWGKVGTWYMPGVPSPGEYTYVQYGVIYYDPYSLEDYLDPWGYSWDLDEPVLSAWASEDQGEVSDGFVMTAGTKVYPNVFSVTPWASALGVPWTNEPVGYESWFSTNETREDTSIGFSGYTGFGDQRGCIPELYYSGADMPSDIYRRRSVVGILRQAADPATCGIEDIMLGVLSSSNGTTTTVSLCLNGVAVKTQAIPTPVGPAEYSDGFSVPFVWFESAWEGPVSEVGIWAGTVDALEISGDGIDGDFISQYEQSDNPAWIPCFGYDTYDVKWAWYIDDYSPSYPVGSTISDGYGGVVLYWADAPSMWTHPKWAVLPPEPSELPKFWQDLDGTEELA